MLSVTAGGRHAYKHLTTSSHAARCGRPWPQGVSLIVRLFHEQRTPLDEITRLRELINRATAADSKLRKGTIVAEYGDLRPLLSYVLSPYCRLYVTATSLRSYLAEREQDRIRNDGIAGRPLTSSRAAQKRSMAAALRHRQEDDALIPSSLLELFQLLASHEINSGLALATASKFLHHHGIIEQHNYALSGVYDDNLTVEEVIRRGLLRPTALDIFTRCLDKNLKAGFNEKNLRNAFVDRDGAQSLSQRSDAGSAARPDGGALVDDLAQD